MEVKLEVHFRNGDVKIEVVDFDRINDKIEELTDIETVVWIREVFL